MCRFAVYVGRPTPLSTLVVDPEHSIIRQSFDARERKGDDASDIPPALNGDGFGVSARGAGAQESGSGVGSDGAACRTA